MPQEPEQKVTSAESANISQERDEGASHASPIDMSPGDHPRVVIVDGKEIYIPQKWVEDLPPPDYSSVKPEEDGREWYEKGEDWVAPQPGPALPIVQGVNQSGYDAVVRELLLPNDAFWRKHAHHEGFRAFIKDKSEAEQKLLAEAFQLDLDLSCPTLDDCIPRGSVLEAVDRYFWEYTDIPRELPFFFVMHHVLATLLQKGVQIHKGKQVILPDLWTMVVARSASGKTLSQKNLDLAMGSEVKLFSEAKTSLKFLTNLRDQRLGLYIRDEFAQFLKNVNKDSSMQDVRDYLLRTYDNSDIEHTTTADSVKVEKSCISILGFNATKTLKLHLTKEMLLDGFAQRFSYCVAEQDDRPIMGDYDFDKLAERIRPLWNKLTSMTVHPVYTVSSDARIVFNMVVRDIITKAREDDIDDSFSRRVAFTTYKYGLAYHILAGKDNDIIDPDDLINAAKLVALHLLDLRKILDMYEDNPRVRPASPASSTANTTSDPHATSPEIDKLAKVKSFLEKRKADKAAPITISNLQASIRALRGSASDTRAMAMQAVSEDPSLAPFVDM